MYVTLLTLHSWVRWFVLTGLISAIIVGYYGWLFKKPFFKSHDKIRHWSATILHIQFTLGITLYFISPIVDYFLNHFKEAIHLREVRFFGMEHSLMMFIAVTLVSVGSAKAKRKKSDQEKFKTMAIWFSVGFLIILSSIPWRFLGLISRPYLRF